MSDLEQRLKNVIRDVPDFPKAGIIFKDITPVLSSSQDLRAIIDHLGQAYADQNIDAVVGMESRGFIFGTPLAIALDAAFVPARKPGKLPYDKIGVEYDLEYGSARLELHTDAIQPGQRVLIVDDLLATGGTAEATCELVGKLGGEVVACCFVIELGFLDGRKRLGDVPVHSIVTY